MNSQRSTVIGVFHKRQEAQRAVDELRRAGFADAHLGVALRDVDSPNSAALAPDARAENAAIGLAAGVGTGAGLGAAWAVGISVGMLPAIGPVIAGGLLGAIVASAAGAGVAGGLVGVLIGLGIPEEDAHYYEGEFKKGKTLVTVHADNRAAEAWAILSRNGAYDRSMSTHTTRDVPVGRDEVVGERTASSSSTSSDVRNM